MATDSQSNTQTDIVADILEWSRTLPIWQRDALRRVVESGTVDDSGIEKLTELCLKEHGGFETEQTAVPFDTSHAGLRQPDNKQVRLVSVSNLQNVNALDTNQTLEFAADGLTVVYGYNGSGKSGFGRILRKLCRCRDRGPTVLSDYRNSGGAIPSADIDVQEGDDPSQAFTWVEGQENEGALGSVSFFDSDCAMQHVRERNDVAFTPYGLDWLPELANAMTAVASRIREQKSSIESSSPPFMRSAERTAGTKVYELLSTLSHKTKPAECEALASLTDEETSRLNDLEAQLSSDPEKRVKEIQATRSIIVDAAKRLASAVETLSDEEVQSAERLATDAKTKRAAADGAARLRFESEPLANLDNDSWKFLWDAARAFSDIAYPNESFPNVSEDSVCVLCQQPLGDEAKDRFGRFDKFVNDKTAKDSEKAKLANENAKRKFALLDLSEVAFEGKLADVTLSEPCREQFAATLSALRDRLKSVLDAYATELWPTEIASLPESAGEELKPPCTALDAKIAEIRASIDVEERRKLESERDELKTRRWLSTVLGDVKTRIEELKTASKLKGCSDKTRTNAVTAKSKSLAATYVNDRLRDAFRDEIKRMEQGVARLNVDMNQTKSSGSGTSRGTAYFQIQLTANTDAEVGRILSEGEHRCIALAGFLAELSLDLSKSSIVLDDPVTSLDHRWRKCFAKRLVDEARTRQVVVFTHDPFFMNMLREAAEKHPTVPYAHRYIQSQRRAAGLVGEESPWDDIKPKDRLDRLEKRVRKLRDDHYQINDDEYAEQTGLVYGRLRETVERVVTTNLLCGIVKRHTEYVRLTDLAKLTKSVTEDHCGRLKTLCDICSNRLSGHDTSSGATEVIPPDEVLSHINELSDVITSINAARNRS